MRGVAATAAVLAVASCGGDDGQNRLTPIDAAVPVDALETYPVVLELSATVNRNLDVLFVIDDSGGMTDKHDNLAASFPSFLAVLNGVPGGFPDLHLGVVTTDMGVSASDGTFGPTLGACDGSGKAGNLTISGASVSGSFLIDIGQSDGSRARNYPDTLEATFSTMAKVGANGCGFEQPLAAMRAALDNNPANAGFLRPDATLAVIFVADEDDCSVSTSAFFSSDSTSLGPLSSFRCTQFGVTCTNGGQTADAMAAGGVKGGCRSSTTSMVVDHIAPYAQFLRGLKADPKQIIVASLVGPASPTTVELVVPVGGGAAVPTLSPSCSYVGGFREESTWPAVRLDEFALQFQARGRSLSICKQDLAPELTSIASLLSAAAGSPCITTPLFDMHPTIPGTQPDCTVEDVIGSTATTILACGASLTPPCWHLVEEPTCTVGELLALRVERDVVPDPATVTRLRCRLP